MSEDEKLVPFDRGRRKPDPARVAALEWAKDGIRINSLHPDAVYDTAPGQENEHYLLTETLAEGWGEREPTLIRDGPRSAKSLSIPLHPAALEYYREHR